jgi:hypothetical protein
MLQQYWEKHQLTQLNWRQELSSMGVTGSSQVEVIEKIIAEKTRTLISIYLFSAPTGESGSILVCHDLGRGVISFGTVTQWGQWDEAYEILTIDGTGEKYNFEGQPLYEGDEGACSLGNV